MLKILGIVVGSITLFFVLVLILAMTFKFVTITFEIIVELYKIWRNK